MTKYGHAEWPTVKHLGGGLLHSPWMVTLRLFLLQGIFEASQLKVVSDVFITYYYGLSPVTLNVDRISLIHILLFISL